MKVTVDEIEKHPSEYLHRVLQGETVILTRDDRLVAEIRPLNTAVGARPIGLAAGEFVGRTTSMIHFPTISSMHSKVSEAHAIATLTRPSATLSRKRERGAVGGEGIVHSASRF